MAYTMDTTLEQLLADPKVKPTLDAYLPGVAANPAVAMVKTMTLRAIVAHPLAASFGITQDKVEAILAEVNKNVQ
jgi:hypothetical protein